MSLQAKLTLSAVVLMTLIVSLISAFDLEQEMVRQFDDTLEHADLLKRMAAKMVVQALDRQRTVPLREALRDPSLSANLVDIMAASHALLEVAVCGRDNEVLADSDPSRLGAIAPPYPDFEPIVRRASWREELRVLYRVNNYYQLQQVLGTPEGAPLLEVRVVIAPALIRKDIVPTLEKNARMAAISVLGAVCLTLLLSTVAFRPLGQVGRMLDLMAQGEFEPGKIPSAKAVEEFGIATKVNLLGERLRGAQDEVSDLQRLLEDLEDAVLLFNRELRLVFASGAVERFLGRMRADLSGRSLSAVFPPNTPLGLLLAQAAQTGRPLRNRRVPLVGAEGTGTVAIVLVSVELLESVPGGPASGTGMIVRLRDPEASRKIGRELQTADRLSAISRITSGVAHEVKNPLNAILLHVEVVRARLKQGHTDVEPQMEIISREILRLDRVVKTFLDFTRPVELRLADVAVEEFVNELVDLARPQAQNAGIQVAVRQEAAGAELRIDRDLMKQAALNVVVNAMEAMPRGGELRFESSVADDSAEIRISDTGAGIPPELREKIFRLYFTTKQEGSGIGLAMTFRIVQLHDGTIDFMSEPGKGTSFVLRLPLALG